MCALLHNRSNQIPLGINLFYIVVFNYLEWQSLKLKLFFDLHFPYEKFFLERKLLKFGEHQLKLSNF
jgi:hypothetical protein